MKEIAVALVVVVLVVLFQEVLEVAQVAMEVNGEDLKCKRYVYR
jgi:hypothetical protein